MEEEEVVASQSVLLKEERLETVEQVSQDDNIISQGPSKDDFSNEQTQIGRISAKINTEGRGNKGVNDDSNSQQPNSYMTEQTIDVAAFNMQTKNTKNVTQNYFMSSKRASESPVKG